MTKHDEAIVKQEHSVVMRAEKMIGKTVKFDRTRRITGYLVGTLDRFNDAKRAEERDRVKHDLA